MTTRQLVDDFVQHKTLALIGASRDKNKFGNIALRELRARGYRVFPVNPLAEAIDGEACYPDLASLPEPVDRLLIVLPPDKALEAVRQAQALGIQRIWLQQGAESQPAIQYCQEKGLQAVYGECILMFAKPVKFPHSAHRWVWGLLGKLPH